jgi:hypothetical protein
MIHGDPDRISLMGHSAGAHLAFSTVLFQNLACVQYIEQIRDEDCPTSPLLAFSALRTTLGYAVPIRHRLRACILLSGVYNIAEHLDYERRRGVDQLSGMKRSAGTRLFF